MEETQDVTPKSDWSIKQIVWEMIKTFALAIVIIIPIRLFLFQPFFVEGESMEPTFKDNEYLIVYEHGYKQVRIGGITILEPSKEFQRGDVVVFHPPVSDKKYYIKRIVGLPGESIAIIRGQVVIYSESHPEGEILMENYIHEEMELSDMPKTLLEKDEYFVMGDNRMFSFDSRNFGPISKERLIGKVLFRALPVTRAGIL
jgi:signal peptidase I